MGRRNGVVVLSSDDDDDDDSRSLSSKRSYTKPKSRSIVTRTEPRLAKKPRISSYRSRPCKGSIDVDGLGMSFEDFDQVLNGFKVSAGSRRSRKDELWADKYKPCSLEELAVHKKKVEEVKAWFEERLRTAKGDGNHVLVLTGPSGVGKSATLHVIASHLGASIYEWNTPTPTIWQEYMHNSNSGVQYTSKLNEFENFVERTRKYGLITSVNHRGPKSSSILVLDDLPMTNGRIAFERLQNCLLLLVRSTQIPTVIVVTDYDKADSGDRIARSSEKLLSFLENAGACKVAFNPITYNSMKKTLYRICRLESCSLTTEQIDLLAKASGGDIRHAITSLQLFCLKPDPVLKSSSPNSSPSLSEEKADNPNTLSNRFSMLFGRDETLSLFHALGKFLHNKRETEKVVEMDEDAFLVKEKFTRLPLKMDTPETVLSQAHGQARNIADFLHENVLDFISEEAMDDAWAVSSYLGDADLLIASFRGMMARYNEADNLLQSAAASVAVRGVLFANHHPMPSRWHAIRRPKLWQVEQSLHNIKSEMVKQRYITYTGSSSSRLSVIATEYKPVSKWLGYRESRSLQSNIIEGKSFENISLDDQESEVSDDEIEDC